MRLSRISMTLVAVLLGACAGKRPEGPVCGDMVVSAPGAGPAGLALSAGSAETQTEAVADRILAGLRARGLGLRKAQSIEIEILSLSAGGQFGAFGAGVMAGWSENPVNPRPPQFQVVTGVSAGALSAPFAAAGAEFDLALREIWYGRDDANTLRRRPLLTLLAAPSVYDLGPAEREVDRFLDDRLMAALASAASQGRQLLLGAVNLDTGRFEVFDLTARDIVGPAPVDAARSCISQAVLASAAIPVGFPPRAVGGALYADGGTRKHVFLPALARAVDRLVAEDGVGRVTVTVTIVVNGDLAVGRQETKYGVLDVGLRAASILIDETLRQSVVEAIDLAVSRGWTVRGITARGEMFPAPAPGKQFDGKVTAALYDAGFARAADPGFRWLDAAALRAEMRRPPG